MAEGVAFSFLGKLAERTVDPIVRQFSHLFLYNSNIENLEKELKRLQAARDGVELQVVAAEHNLETIDPAMQLWLKGVDEIERKTSTVIERKSKVEIMCLNLGCPNVKQRYLLSRKASKLIDDIGKHKGDGVKYAKSTNSAPPPGIVTDVALTPELPTRITFSRSTTSFEGFESRKLIVEQVMEALKDDRISRIGICGIGGVGKTTMANEVCRRARAQGLFEEFAMTSVSQMQDLHQIQKELAGMLGLQSNDNGTMFLRAQDLRARLSNGKKILVILDDVWQELPLQQVGIPMGCKECKVICTSRSRDVLSDMEAHCFDVGILTNTESWDLFKANAGNFNQSATAEKIVKKCGGLPIAIITLAKALKNKEKHVWDNALRHLEESTGEEIRGMADHVYKCIELSYKFLKDSEARILLLCCLFPEDTNIPVEILVRFKDLPALEVTYVDGMRTLVGDLISSNLLVAVEFDFPVPFEDELGRVKVHDVIRDVCLSIEGLNRLGQNRELLSVGIANRSFTSRKFYKEAGSQAFEKVTDAVADDQICAIGLLYNVRETPILLVTEVIEKVKEDNLFADVAAISVSQAQDMFKMQGDLAEMLGLASLREVTSITERAKQLRARLTYGRRRSLIILFGVCEKIDLEKVGIPVGAEHNNGCKVIIVSSDQDVCLNMGIEKIVIVDPMSNEEALVLLREHTGRFNEELDPTAKQIVEKCEGDPWTIVRFGEALKNQDEKVWLDALGLLNGGRHPSICTLKFSYNRLS